MPEVDELRRRARRAEADGEYREALQIYREALRSDRQASGDARDPRLLLRVGDVHARLEERRDAVDAYTRAAELYAGQGLVTNAVAVCHKILRVYPDETEGHRLLAAYQADMGLTAEARQSLTRYLDAAEEGDADIGHALEAVRAFLEEEPDQALGLRAARILERAGRTGDALDLLRSVWEKRTGRRRPAGDVERAVRRLAPHADIGAWTPEWPPVGGEGAGGKSGRSVGSDADLGRSVDGDAALEDAPVEAVGAAVPSAEGPLAAAVETVGGGDGGGEDDGGTEPEEGPDGGRRFMRRYRRSPRPGGRGGEEDEGAAAGAPPDAAEGSGGPPEDDAGGPARPPQGAAAVRPSPPPDPEEHGPAAGERTAAGAEVDAEGVELRRGLGVLEELMELDPADPGLRRRKVLYARRLGDPELLEEALTELGDHLSGRGEARGARLVYQEVLDRLNPRSGAAQAGLRAVEATARSALEVARERRPGEARAAAGSRGVGGTPEVSEMDEEFRRRVSEALDRAPDELTHLQAAGLASAVRTSEEPVPWWAHRELGRYLLLRRRPEEASRHLAAALDRAPPGDEEADVLYHLGIAHRRAGDVGSSRECFRRLADLDAGFATAWAAVSG